MTSISKKNLVAIREKIDSQANIPVRRQIRDHPWLECNKMIRNNIYDEWSLVSTEIFLKLNRSLNVVVFQITSQF